MHFLSKKPLSSFTPEEFHLHVKNLYYVDTVNKESISAPGITLYFGKRTIIRVKRDPKTITREEITELSKEYDKEEAEMLKIFKTRKIEVTYADSDARKDTDRTACEEGNDKPRKTRKRKVKSTNKLLVDGHAEHLHEEGKI